MGDARPPPSPAIVYLQSFGFILNSTRSTHLSVRPTVVVTRHAWRFRRLALTAAESWPPPALVPSATPKRLTSARVSSCDWVHPTYRPRLVGGNAHHRMPDAIARQRGVAQMGVIKANNT